MTTQWKQNNKGSQRASNNNKVASHHMLPNSVVGAHGNQESDRIRGAANENPRARETRLVAGLGGVLATAVAEDTDTEEEDDDDDNDDDDDGGVVALDAAVGLEGALDGLAALGWVLGAGGSFAHLLAQAGSGFLAGRGGAVDSELAVSHLNAVHAEGGAGCLGAGAGGGASAGGLAVGGDFHEVKELVGTLNLGEFNRLGRDGGDEEGENDLLHV